jgi:hypothetical protein
VVPAAKGLDQLRIDLGRAPGHPPPLESLGAMLCPVLVFAAGEAGERPSAEGIEVQVVVGALARNARLPPEVGIDRMLGQVVGVAREQLAQGRGQGEDRLAIDEAMAGEAPGLGERGRGEEAEEAGDPGQCQRRLTERRTGTPLRSTTAWSSLSVCRRG